MPAYEKGLSTKEAGKRLLLYGANTIPEKRAQTSFSILLSQFKSPLVYILLFAGIASLVLGELGDSAIILFAVLVNTLLGFVQERRASKSLSALKKILQLQTRVIRDSELIKIDTSKIVPGDLVFLKHGEKVPADGKVVESSRLSISEAVLTGESVPVEKAEGDNVSQGTIVLSGSGKILIERTGLKTEFGKIASSVQEVHEETPFEKQLNTFSKQLSLLVLGLTAFVFVTGIFSRMALFELFTTSVALAVSAIPEGLLVALTVVLAVGMQRILKKRGLVRNLLSAETLGGVTTICTDKTGTLTQGKLEVIETVGEIDEIIKQSFLTNDDPVMEPIPSWIENNKVRTEYESSEVNERHKRLDSIPFSPENRYFATLNRWDETNNMILVNGAPEVILKRTNVEEDENKKLHDLIDSYTKEGKRLIGLARKKVPLEKVKFNEEDLEENLEWVGMIVFFDPVRKGAGEVLSKFRKAGIKVLLITGDYAQTAVTVMRELGIEIDLRDVVLGSELEEMDGKDLEMRLNKLFSNSDVGIFARTKPQQKLKIVESLKEIGEAVAMMGDGINDAPALHNADIGIVVGEATDVAKESADLVLLDSDFKTVIEAIEEGRGIFDNLRKIILYLLSDAFEEIIAVVGTLILRLPLPVTAAQILWINIISDGFPHLALTIDPKDKDIMKRLPRSPKEKVVSLWMRKLIVIVSLTGGVLALSIFIYMYKTSGNLGLAQSAAFATLGINSLIYVFSVRTLTSPFWKQNPFKNRWLNAAVILGLVFQVLPFTMEFTRNFFRLEILSFLQWLMVFSASIIMFITIEISKNYLVGGKKI